MNTPLPKVPSSVAIGLIVAALGVVYGDIGTSPLYAFRICFDGPGAIPTTPENILGVLSLIFWSLIILISIKYLSFVLRADNKGEGGILAITTLLVKAKDNAVLKRSLVLLLGLFGAALLYGDGLITPVISVLSAVEGLNTATPAFTPYVVPISLTVLLFLFWFQKRGSGAIGKVFGPIMIVWFSVIGFLGLFSVAANPAVFLAIDPRHILPFFLHNRAHAFFTLGTLFLVLTGGEALYADIGHFGTRPIRAGWFYIVLPALVLNYFGQGAFLLRNPTLTDNLFYRLAPPWAVIPLVALATVATVIASQAVISGVFSLARQSVQLGYLPRLSIIHTSNTTIGQVYVPVFNWLLCFGTVILVLAFRQSDSLAGAYGVAVATTMMITTLLLFLIMRRTWNWNPFAAGGICAVFFLIDFTFFCANLLKIRDGGWISLAVAGCVMFLMITWDDGRRLLRGNIASAALSMKDFIADIVPHKPLRVPGISVFLAGAKGGVPRTLLHNYKHNKILHHQVVALTVSTKEVPAVDESERLEVDDLGNGFFWITARYGFSETPNIPSTLSSASVRGISFDPMQTTFFLGRETLIVSREKGGMSMLRKGVFAFLSRNACDASKFFRIPPNRVIEIGIQVEL
jgi:KUP system potassium uptake protein